MAPRLKQTARKLCGGPRTTKAAVLRDYEAHSRWFEREHATVSEELLELTQHAGAQAFMDLVASKVRARIARGTFAPTPHAALSIEHPMPRRAALRFCAQRAQAAGHAHANAPRHPGTRATMAQLKLADRAKTMQLQLEWAISEAVKQLLEGPVDDAAVHQACDALEQACRELSVGF